MQRLLHVIILLMDWLHEYVTQDRGQFLSSTCPLLPSQNLTLQLTELSCSHSGKVYKI